MVIKDIVETGRTSLRVTRPGGDNNRTRRRERIPKSNKRPKGDKKKIKKKKNINERKDDENLNVLYVQSRVTNRRELYL